MIRKISWWILFLFYGIPLLVNVPWSFISISRILMTDSNIWQEAMAFPYPLPEFLAKMMPSRLGTMLVALFLLNLLLAVFPAHRVWLMLSGREKVCRRPITGWRNGWAWRVRFSLRLSFWESL